MVAWLDGEETAPLGHIAAVVDEIDSKAANLIVSMEIYKEVLEAKRSKRKMQRFRKFLSRSNILVVDTTFVVADKAQVIRSNGVRAKRSIKSPDATFMAAAILFNADMLHTLDAGMLSLDGSPIVDGLAIKTPQTASGQGYFDGMTEADDDDDDDEEEDDGDASGK